MVRLQIATFYGSVISVLVLLGGAVDRNSGYLVLGETFLRDGVLEGSPRETLCHVGNVGVFANFSRYLLHCFLLVVDRLFVIIKCLHLTSFSYFKADLTFSHLLLKLVDFSLPIELINTFLLFGKCRFFALDAFELLPDIFGLLLINLLFFIFDIEDLS